MTTILTWQQFCAGGVAPLAGQIQICNEISGNGSRGFIYGGVNASDATAVQSDPQISGFYIQDSLQNLLFPLPEFYPGKGSQTVPPPADSASVRRPWRRLAASWRGCRKRIRQRNSRRRCHFCSASGGGWMRNGIATWAAHKFGKSAAGSEPPETTHLRRHPLALYSAVPRPLLITCKGLPGMPISSLRRIDHQYSCTTPGPSQEQNKCRRAGSISDPQGSA